MPMQFKWQLKMFKVIKIPSTNIYNILNLQYFETYSLVIKIDKSKGYPDCDSTNTYCAYNRSVTESLWHFVLIYLSHATSWTRRSSEASEVKIEI